MSVVKVPYPLVLFVDVIFAPWHECVNNLAWQSNFDIAEAPSPLQFLQHDCHRHLHIYFLTKCMSSSVKRSYLGTCFLFHVLEHISPSNSCHLLRDCWLTKATMMNIRKMGSQSCRGKNTNVSFSFFHLVC